MAVACIVGNLAILVMSQLKATWNCLERWLVAGSQSLVTGNRSDSLVIRQMAPQPAFLETTRQSPPLRCQASSRDATLASIQRCDCKMPRVSPHRTLNRAPALLCVIHAGVHRSRL